MKNSSIHIIPHAYDMPIHRYTYIDVHTHKWYINIHIIHTSQASHSFPMFDANPEAAVSIDMPAGPSEQLCVGLKVSEKCSLLNLCCVIDWGF